MHRGLWEEEGWSQRRHQGAVKEARRIENEVTSHESCGKA